MLHVVSNASINSKVSIHLTRRLCCLTPSFHHPILMETSLDDKKTTIVVDEQVCDQAPPRKQQRWIEKTATFLAHWGIETNGYRQLQVSQGSPVC